MVSCGSAFFIHQHEPCWYVRKKNAAWFGKAGENSTIWDSPSPKFIMGGSDEEKFDHPTQKPVELMRRPILNHTKRGEGVYDPFLGSGTTLAAAELAERVCYGFDPKYVDVIVQRWQGLAAKHAVLEGDERSFDEISRERLQELLDNQPAVPREYCIRFGDASDLFQSFTAQSLANFGERESLRIRQA